MLAAPLRVIVIARDPLARAGLATLLGEQEELAIVARVAAGAALGEAQHLYQPDVGVWDLGWEGTLDQRGDADSLPFPLVVLVSGEQQAAEALAAGARSVLPRDVEGTVLAAAIVAVWQGLMVIPPTYVGTLGIREQMTSPLEDALTPRELEVVRLLAEGLPNKLIADRLGISDHTVKFHVNAILGKLGAHSRTEAVTRAARTGLIEL